MQMRRRGGRSAQPHSTRPRAHFPQISRESDVVNTAVILCYSWQYSVTAGCMVPVGTLTVCWYINSLLVPCVFGLDEHFFVAFKFAIVVSKMLFGY